MEKVRATPDDQAQLQSWIKVLQDNGRFYELTTNGNKVALIVDKADAFEFLGFKPISQSTNPRVNTVGRGCLIAFVSVIGFVIIMGVVATMCGRSYMKKVENEITLNYKDVIWKTSAELQSKFGKPTEVNEIKNKKDLCHNGKECQWLIWGTWLEVTTRNDTAIKFTYRDTLINNSKIALKRIGMDEQEPDFSNEFTTRWENVQGFSIVASPLDKGVIIVFKQLSQKEISNIDREKVIRSHFSEFGYHENLQSYIMSNMNDPGSYEHIQTTYEDSGEDFYYVRSSFRGKNAFGGRVLQTVVAKVDFAGNILEVETID